MNAKAIIQNGTVQTMCRMCDTRCAVKIQIDNGIMTDVTPDANHPVNEGRMCVRGAAVRDLFYHPDRILKPLKRTPDGTFMEISYEQALDEIAEKALHIKKESGTRAMSVWKGEAVGFFQQEEYARRFIQAFGSPNYFSNDATCFNGRYLAYRLVNGFWDNFPEFEHADLVILWGTNPPACHMPFMREIADAMQRGAKLIVIDTRRNPIAYQADIFARPMTATDGALAWGLCRYLITTNNYDHQLVEDYSVGFDQFAAYAEKFTPEYVEQQTGVDRQTVVEIAEMIARRRPKVSMYPGTGLEHQKNGVNNIRVIAALESLVGALDIKGGCTWRESLGGRNLTLYDELPLFDQQPIGADTFPVLYDLRKECHTMTAMEYMLDQGEYPLRGMILTAANPAVSNPNTRKVTEALSNLDLFVVNDFFLTRTAKLAHYVLPAATFLERSELHYYSKYQRVGLSQKVFEIPGVHDEYTLWHDLAHRLGFGEKYFPWSNEEEVTRWILEPTGITLEELQNHPEGLVYKPIRYKKYETAPLPTPSGTGKVEFASEYLKKFGLSEIPEYIPPYYLQVKKNYPFVLQTGARKPLLYHSGHQNIPRFRTILPTAQVEIHPATAARLDLKDKDRVKIISEIGSVEVEAKIVHKNEILPDVLELYHGWQDSPPNFVTFDLRNDPISGFPSWKAVPVRVEKIQK